MLFLIHRDQPSPRLPALITPLGQPIHVPCHARPLQGLYQLMTAFPNKLIEDEGQSLEAAGLLNAVIIAQKK